jgi:hypothetical protein
LKSLIGLKTNLLFKKNKQLIELLKL